jgi:hypothetical protein
LERRDAKTQSKNSELKNKLYHRFGSSIKSFKVLIFFASLRLCVSALINCRFKVNLLLSCEDIVMQFRVDNELIRRIL